ncbi:mechanosensitive ion channel family protein [Blastopirellula marina]|uniref:Mechanosensitive ion channel protein MscS n=1 Tax=Blastopirellula marina TaxID=124 RepID=A0A2S8FCZ1_9BACT|nr:mechanosensitive ion channel domain-containing protein [Blastopirellula marina]PQO29980.1 mechanosensitive ion channel protein MscS [Blastopirellula marina]PTL42448.1 mechanosensitive ion channel protein MscS [Blastopirellula marina]
MFLLAQANGKAPEDAITRLSDVYSQAHAFLIEQGPIWATNLVAAVAVLLVGWIASRFVRGLMVRGMKRSRLDNTLAGFLSNIAYALLIGLVVIAALNQLGINTTSLAAVVGAAGLAIGLALQNSLSNLASGIMLILFRPFGVGDFVEAGGATGVVQEVHIFHTIMRSIDNKRIIVPNGEITSAVVTNFTGHATRMVELEIGCGYNDDIRAVKQFLIETLEQDERIMEDPAIEVRVFELGDSAIIFKVRGWVKTPDWWATRCDLMEAIKLGMDQRGFHIPFPQRDVHLFQEEGKLPA